MSTILAALFALFAASIDSSAPASDPAARRIAPGPRIDSAPQARQARPAHNAEVEMHPGYVIVRDPEVSQRPYSIESRPSRWPLAGRLPLLASRVEFERIGTVHPNAFFGAAREAYDRHLPLELSPDIVWLAILQGFAIHVNKNAEALRTRFVSHRGKKVVQVLTGEDYEASPDAWERMFADLRDSLRAQLGNAFITTTTARFSTTTDVQAAVFDATLLTVVKEYYEFRGGVGCGIPWLKIHGTPGDWQQLIRRTQALADYDLDWWTSRLVPILREFEKASRGEPDIGFWRSMALLAKPTSCGPARLDGWITTFFPYVSTDQVGVYRRNPLLLARKRSSRADAAKTARSKDRTASHPLWRVSSPDLGSDLQHGPPAGGTPVLRDHCHRSTTDGPCLPREVRILRGGAGSGKRAAATGDRLGSPERRRQAARSWRCTRRGQHASPQVASRQGPWMGLRRTAASEPP